MKAFLKYWLTDSKNPKKYLLDILLAILILVSVLIVIIENFYENLPIGILYLDFGILIFFILEYAARFYICSDFILDYRNRGLLYAIHQKLRWMSKSSSIIDLLAIIPAISYLRGFRILRYFKLLRITKLFTAFRVIRDIHKLLLILKGMREESRIFYLFFSSTIGLLFITSLGLYIVEKNTSDEVFSSFTDTLWYVFMMLELADDTPTTVLGKLLSVLLLFSNMAIFGFFISIIINKIKYIMDALTSGKINQLKTKNHTVICGYTKSSQEVINDLLKEKQNHNKIVLITTKQIDDINGLIYINADYTECKTLEKVSISDAKNAIVFSEPKEHDTIRDTDLRTVMTIFHIEKMAPQVHTIAEIHDSQNAEIIKDRIKGDEIIYKELIDAKIISNCIRNPNISNLFYSFFGTEKERIQSTTLQELNISDTITIKELKNHFTDQNQTFIGVIDHQQNSYLSPNNDLQIDAKYQLIYLA